MSVLIIGVAEMEAIKVAMERARARPLPFDLTKLVDQTSYTVTLAERERVGFERRKYQSQQVLIPNGFRLAISFEQQPAGLCAHFSISLDGKPGMLPNPNAVASILNACGFDVAEYPSRQWIEEFLIDGKPGGQAINVVLLVDPAVAGHA